MKQRTFGLVGKNISYSFSRRYFNEKFAAAELNCTYVNFDIDSIESLPQILANNDISGLNITIPYKEAILPFLDDISPDAAAVGAVNTIKINDGKLTGHNTDWIGFRDSMQPLLQPHHQKALILGTGGASKAVAYALEKMKIEYATVSRSPLKNNISYRDINELVLSEYKIIINCTPTGTFPDVDKAPELPYHLIGNFHLLYDLVYNPEMTLFLQNGQKAGATIKNGYEMLQLQAEAAWRIWNS